ncbi:MAG: hypothetical protein EOP45_23255, partial [Sphingobacteriaceae bacterium]
MLLFNLIISLLSLIMTYVFLENKTRQLQLQLENEIKNLYHISPPETEADPKTETTAPPLSESSWKSDLQTLQDQVDANDARDQVLLTKYQDLQNKQAGDTSSLQTGIDVLANQVLKAGAIFVTNADETDVEIRNLFN